MKLVTHLHLGSGLRMGGVIALLPLYAVTAYTGKGRVESCSSSSNRPDWVLGPLNIIFSGHRIVFNRLESARCVKLKTQMLVVSNLKNSDALPQLVHILPLST